MIGRVTNQTMAHAAIKNLQTGKAALAEKQEQAATLAAITKPSDDPTGTGDSMRIRAAQRAENQYNRNITDGTNWLNTAETALSASSSIISRVRDLTVQGANGTMSATAKEAIARELEGLKQDLLSSGEHELSRSFGVRGNLRCRRRFPCRLQLHRRSRQFGGTPCRNQPDCASGHRRCFGVRRGCVIGFRSSRRHCDRSADPV